MLRYAVHHSTEHLATQRLSKRNMEKEGAQGGAQGTSLRACSFCGSALLKLVCQRIGPSEDSISIFICKGIYSTVLKKIRNTRRKEEREGGREKEKEERREEGREIMMKGGPNFSEFDHNL